LNGRKNGDIHERLPLIKRLARAQSGVPDPGVEEAAIRAMDQWPLMGLLTQELRSAPRPVPLRVEAVDPSGVSPRQPAPIDQMFVRLERITKPANGDGQTAAPAHVTSPVPSAPQAVPPAPAPTPLPPETPVTIEPRTVLHHDSSLSPARLFERMKN